MILSRLATTLGILYSLPLLTWMIGRLNLIEWTPPNLQALFHQSLFAILLLQTLTVGLLFIAQGEEGWRERLFALLQTLLFPLPLLVLIWLAGGASLDLILKAELLFALFAVVAYSLEVCGKQIQWRSQYFPLSTLLQLCLALTVWNTREFWWNWLTL